MLYDHRSGNVRLGCECPEPGYCYTIEHGGYRKENIDIEYCEQVAAMGKDSDIIKFKQISKAAEAVCMKVYGPYNRLNENIREVLEWIEANGYTITYPPRYSYVDGIWNQEDPENWLTIIQVPVKNNPQARQFQYGAHELPTYGLRGVNLHTTKHTYQYHNITKDNLECLGVLITRIKIATSQFTSMWSSMMLSYPAYVVL